MEFIELLKAFPNDWHYDYNDAFFSSYDWSVEPQEDLNTLYRKRAEELRQKHDYLVLFYSGGYDSSNVLYSFLDNGIKIDEIVTWYSQYDKDQTDMMYELKTFTYDKLKALKDKYPDQKITYWEYGQYFPDWHKHITRTGAQDNAMHILGGGLITMNRLLIDFAHEYNKEWDKLLQAGKSVGFIQGADKPMVRYKDKQWIFNFHDGIMQGRFTPARQIMDDGSFGSMELFYWAPTPACADIIRKQCHTIKRKYNPQAQIDFSQIPGAKTPHNPNYGWEIDTINFQFVQTIYPRLWQEGTIIVNERYHDIKSNRNIFGHRDQWFTDHSNHQSVDLYKNIWQSANSNSVYQEWYNDGNDIRSGIRSCLSRNYVI